MDIDGLPPFADLLENLFQRHLKPNGRPYSNEEVASSIQASTGISVTQSYIWMLRKGKRDDPRGSLIQALACFFDVPAGYFLDEPTYRHIEESWLIRSEANADTTAARAATEGSATISLRVSRMSPTLQELFGRLIEYVSELDNRKGP